MKQLLFLFGTLAALLFSTPQLRANEGATDPMRLFNRLRESAIKKDVFNAKFNAGGELLRTLNTSGIPKELRDNLIEVTAAFEDVYIRRQNPDQAVVYAFYKAGNTEKCMKVEFGKNSMGLLKINRISSGEPQPDPMVPFFAAACRSGKSEAIKEFISDELAEKLTAIPFALTQQETPKIRRKSLSGKRAVFELEYKKIYGSIELTRNNYVWEITGIDPFFFMELPDVVIGKFSTACREYIRECKKAQWEAKINNEEDYKKVARQGDFHWKVKNFFIERDFDYIKNNVTEEQLTCFANLPEVSNWKIGSGHIILYLNVHNETQKGTCEVTVKPYEETWRISKIKFNLKNAVAERLIVRLLNRWKNSRTLDPDLFFHISFAKQWENALGKIDFSDAVLPDNVNVSTRNGFTAVNAVITHQTKDKPAERITFYLAVDPKDQILKIVPQPAHVALNYFKERWVNNSPADARKYTTPEYWELVKNAAPAADGNGTVSIVSEETTGNGVRIRIKVSANGNSFTASRNLKLQNGAWLITTDPDTVADTLEEIKYTPKQEKKQEDNKSGEEK